mgnify:CR=1 FL=1
MINYYELCNISPSASQEEIKKTIYQLMRLWSHRTNAPQMERRQEAERMVRLLEEAEEILLDEEKRKEYDEKLRLSTRVVEKAPVETSEPSSYELDAQRNEVTATKEKVEDELTTEQIEENIQQAQQLFSTGKLKEALQLAEELSEKVKDRAEIWALIGRLQFRLGNYQEAVAPLVKACDLESKNATYVFELGEVFERLNNPTRALEQFKLASALDPSNIQYKFKVGNLLIQMKQFRDGLPLLEQCFNASPNHEEYRVGLVKAYLDSAFSNWITIEGYHPYLSPGTYPIRELDLSLADTYIKRASQIPFQDLELSNQLQQCRLEIKRSKGLKFTGSWFMAFLSLIFLIITQYINPSDLNLVFIGLPFIYVLSALTPKYQIYEKAYQNESPKTDFAYLYEKLKDKFGTIGAWFISLILIGLYFFATAFVMSLVIIYNVIRKIF